MPMQNQIRAHGSYRRKLTFAILAMAVFAITSALGAHAQTYTVLYNFEGNSDGGYPYAGVTPDEAGNLYGTTRNGGMNNCLLGCGVAYKLSPPSSGSGPWIETVLHTFTTGSDGATPTAGLIPDGAGNVYGATFYGGHFTSA